MEIMSSSAVAPVATGDVMTAPEDQPAGRRPRLYREILLIALCYSAYSFVRNLVPTTHTEALRLGRQRIHLLNAAPIDDIADRWIGRFHRPRARALGDLKHALEAPPMTDTDTVTTTDFVYVTYIRTTAEELFRAITEPEFTQRYWGASILSDWEVGSPIRWEEGGSTIEGQEVLAVDRPRLLSYSWHHADVLHQEHTGWTDEQIAAEQAEPRSKVTFTLEDADPGVVKLTVVHDGFAPGSVMLDAISGGWPGILASLKTLLETGAPLGA